MGFELEIREGAGRNYVEQLGTSLPPLRILGMVASPSDLEPLDVKDEQQLVEEAIKILQMQ